MNRHNSGVALIVVLSIMAVLAILAVAFSKAMRDQRLASRNYADQISAEHFIQAGLARALDHLESDLRGTCYPFLSMQASDAAGSYNPTNPVCNLLVGEATNMIPRALWAGARSVTCNWVYIIGTNDTTTTMTNGRVAFLVLNCSGLLDVNYLGGTYPRVHGTNITELDPEALLEITNAGGFLMERDDLHRRYDTVAEIGALNSAVAGPVTNLFVYSHDPGRDVYPLSYVGLGLRDIVLTNKLNVNGTGLPGYWDRLTNLLMQAQYNSPTNTNTPTATMRTCAEGIAWNIVNYIDTNSVPETGSATPWLEVAGCEATPLINEIALVEVTNNPVSYRINVELWYPFAPETAAAGEYRLQIVVHTNLPVDIADDADLSATSPDWQTNHLIGAMAFGTNNEFRVYSSPVFQLGGPSSALPVSSTRPIWFLARVARGAVPVDQAISSTNLQVAAFTNAESYCVEDPRLNADPSFWTIMASNTLGTMNANCDPWTNNGQGLPISFRNGAMESIGEIGHIFMPYTPWPPTTNPAPPLVPWRSINLTDYFSGAALLDWLTVRATNTSARGLVHPCTRQRDVRAALFYNTRIRDTSAPGTGSRYLTSNEVYSLADSIDGRGVNLRTIFYDIGTNAVYQAMPLENELREDALRSIVEMLTLRQNLFTVIIAAQALSKDGQGVLAEKRAMAIVARDTYTGQSFVRLFKWLSK